MNAQKTRSKAHLIVLLTFSLFLGLFTSFVSAPVAQAAAKGSLYFPGNAAVQSEVYSLDAPGTGQFTYEGWFKIDPAWTGDFFLFTTRESEWDSRGFSLRVAKKANGKGALFSQGGARNFLVASATGYLETNTWYHFAVTREADGLFRYYANGIHYGTSAQTAVTSLSMGNIMFGLWFKGWMTNFRTTIGSALYTEAGTKPMQNDAQLTRDATQTLFMSDYSNMRAITSRRTQLDLTNATIDQWGNKSITQIATTSDSNPFPMVTPVLSWSNADKTYGGSGFSLTSPSATPAVDGAYTYSSATPSVISLSGSTATIGQVGSSLITATFTPTDTSSYESATATMTITVGKATPTFTWSGVTKVYGGSDFTLTPPTTAIAGSFVYSSASTSVISLTGDSATVGVAGSSLVTATFTPSDTTSYYSGETKTMTIQVDGAPLVITASSPTVTYGDSAPTITPSFSAFIGAETSTVISGLTCSAPTYSNTSSVGSNPATTCSGGSATNYALSYTPGSVSILRSAQPNDLVLTSTSGTYGTNVTLSASGGLGGGTLSYSVISGPCQLSPSGLELVSTAVGTCSVQATRAASTNYESVLSPPTNVLIGKKNLTIGGLSGVNKEYDGNRTATLPTGTPTLVGKVGADIVTLSGTPVFSFETFTVGSSINVAGTGYSLTNTHADNYTLTQPTVTADITPRALTITANNRSFGFSESVTATIATSGLISPDQIASVTYTYSATGTDTPPTAVGTSIITPSLATFSTGLASNYSITYVAGNLEILSAYTVTFDANRGTVSPSSALYVPGLDAINLPTPSRSNYYFDGWFDEASSPAVKISGSTYAPTSNKNLVAHWTQSSLVGLSSYQVFGSITALTGNGGSTIATRSGTRAEVEYYADTLPNNTVITAYLQGSTTYAASQLSGVSNLLLSVVVAWKAPDETVPDIDPSKDAIRLTITNPNIKRGAKVYSIVGDSTTVLTTATQDGLVTIQLRQDPEIVIANPVEVPPPPAPPAPAPPTVSIVATPIVITVDTTEADLKAAQELAAQQLQKAREIAQAQIKAAQLAADEATRLKAEDDARIAAQLKAKQDAEIAAALAIKKVVPAVTLYSITPTFKLSVYDSAYLRKYVSTLKSDAVVTCIGYIYPSKTSPAKAKATAMKQATSVCNVIKKARKSLTTKTVIYPASKAPKAAAGAKWVAVSYRIDGFKSA